MWNTAKQQNGNNQNNHHWILHHQTIFVSLKRIC